MLYIQIVSFYLTILGVLIICKAVLQGRGFRLRVLMNWILVLTIATLIKSTKNQIKLTPLKSPPNPQSSHQKFWPTYAPQYNQP